MKKLIFDVMYHEDTNKAVTAALEFNEISDKVETKTYTDISDIASEYIPGEFYKRELPAIMSLLKNVIGFEVLAQEYDLIIVDGLYQLAPDHLGLGARLHEALKEIGVDIEIIGIAKTYYKDCDIVAGKVFRGNAKKPLYVNGSLQNKNYVQIVEQMSGEYRLPYLVKRVDTVCRM